MSSFISLRGRNNSSIFFRKPHSLHRRLYKPPFLHFSALSFFHGPSLRHGRPPPPPPPRPSDQSPPPSSVESSSLPLPSIEDSSLLSDSDSIDRSKFTRSFDVVGLRVAAADCSALEHRLRGHLLNWPRVRNVARVRGDDLHPSLLPLLSNSAAIGSQLVELSDESGGVAGIDGNKSALLSPVLYREKLAKEFNCRGFLKFRNLAKISRPKKKNDKKKSAAAALKKSRVGCEGEVRLKKNEVYAVEVLGEEEEEDMRVLLGEEFVVGKWRGPTRLLLLDERYANKTADELPEAVKVVLQGSKENRHSVLELVQCRLTLFYDYWQMNEVFLRNLLQGPTSSHPEVLEALLPEAVLVPTGFETVGHIAHLNLRDEHLPFKKIIAQVVLDKNKTNIKTVVNKIDAIHNNYRTMELEVLAGNNSLVTTVVENGVRFQVDLQVVYWNSRLSYERQRILDGFTNSDVVCDVFSGVGPIAISAAKKVKYVYANDLNPKAVEYLERNVVLNKLERKIEVYNMDGRRFIEAIFAVHQPCHITHVVMNLPNDAAEFLDAFRGIFYKRQRADGIILPKIHVYGFSKAQDPEFDFHERINIALGETVGDVEFHRVRLVAPGKWMLCASLTLPHNVAVAKRKG